MQATGSKGIAAAIGQSDLLRWALPLAAAALFWFDPSNGFATAILWGAGLYALWNGRRTLAAWKNPVGLCFGLGVLWAVLSVAWSFYPVGSARDLVKSAPLALATLAMPVLFDRPGRIWAALLAITFSFRSIGTRHD